MVTEVDDYDKMYKAIFVYLLDMKINKGLDGVRQDVWEQLGNGS